MIQLEMPYDTIIFKKIDSLFHQLENLSFAYSVFKSMDRSLSTTITCWVVRGGCYMTDVVVFHKSGNSSLLS